MVTAKYVLYVVQHTKVVQGPRITQIKNNISLHNSCLKWQLADWNSFCRIFLQTSFTRATQSTATYRHTVGHYFPYHLWKRTLSTVLDIIAVWVLRELKKKGGGGEKCGCMSALCNIWQTRRNVISDYFWRSEKRRSEVFFNYFRIYGLFWRTSRNCWVVCTKKTWGNVYHPERGCH